MLRNLFFSLKNINAGELSRKSRGIPHPVFVLLLLPGIVQVILEVLAAFLDFVDLFELVHYEGAEEIHEDGGEDDIAGAIPPYRGPVLVAAKGNRTDLLFSPTTGFFNILPQL